MKAAAVYFLLLTIITLISVGNSTCYCSSKTSSADIPSIFSHQQPSTFPVSLPLLSFDEIRHHIPPSTAGSDVHPFEDLFVYIFFEDGSCVYYMMKDFDVGSAAESTVSDIKASLPSVSEINKTAAPFFDAVEEKVSPIFSSLKDTIAPVLSAPIVSKVKKEISPVIIESYKYGLEYTKNLQQRVAPIISDIEDKAASVVDDVISNVEDTIAPYISSESEDNACESFSLSKFLPNVEVMTNSNNGNMENDVEEDLTIPDEEDFILVIELVGDDEVAHDSHSEVYDVAPSHEEDSPFLQTLFKLLCILAVGLTSLLSLLYVFVLSIVIYVFVKDYFAEKYDADANEHFRELLNQIRGEHCRRRPTIPLPAPPPRQMNQEQQTDDEEEEGNDGGDEYYVIEPTDDVFEAPAAAANDEECSSEVDVSMDDTTSHSCA